MPDLNSRAEQRAKDNKLLRERLAEAMEWNAKLRSEAPSIGSICVKLSDEGLGNLQIEAAKRGKVPAQLALELLETVTNDGLFKAVLDD